MKNFIGAVLLLLALNVNASLIDNGTYTTDTASGLDWLDLSATILMTYEDAQISNPGWRHATNAEVEVLFGTLFAGYYDTGGPPPGISDSFDGSYADQNEDVYRFQLLFGVTEIESGPPPNDLIRTYGLYIDENDALTLMGAFQYSDIERTVIIGIDNTFVYDIDSFPYGPADMGTYLVRNTIIPIPPAIWLFGSGLLGLIGLARRRANA